MFVCVCVCVCVFVGRGGVPDKAYVCWCVFVCVCSMCVCEVGLCVCVVLVGGGGYLIIELDGVQSRVEGEGVVLSLHSCVLIPEKKAFQQTFGVERNKN